MAKADWLATQQDRERSKEASACTKLSFFVSSLGPHATAASPGLFDGRLSPARHLAGQQLISSACHYCSQHPSSQTRIGIDRINSCGNYEITNCVPCCARCNFMKGSLNYREFINHAKLITFSMRTRDLPYTSAPLFEPPFGTPGKRRKRAS